MASYVPPAPNKAAFTCPYCRTLAQMRTPRVLLNSISGTRESELGVSECSVCEEETVWWQNQMLRPNHGELPPPHEATPADVGAIYEEAAAISGASPRAAAALLRLALETLLRGTGRTETTLNDMIGALAASGLPPDVVKAMDVVRVHGNDSIHAGQIVMGDSAVTVATLADLTNFVTDTYVARPKRIAALYDAIPQNVREAAERRNQKHQTKS